MMKKYSLYIIIGIVCWLFVACHDNDDVSASSQAGVVTLNVDVIMPASQRAQLQPTIDWAMENIQRAQQQRSQKVRLNLRFHDEDQEDLGSLAFNLTHPLSPSDTCHALIGPMRSVDVAAVLPYVQYSSMPVILPTCSSATLQRQLAKNTHVWLLTESDITQCEVMLASVRLNGDNPKVALVYSDDVYGGSFKDWFGFFATEYQMDIPTNGIRCYKQGDDLLGQFADWLDDGTDRLIYIYLALSSVEAYQDVLSQLEAYQEKNENANNRLFPLCTDVAMDDALVQQNHFFFGISPVADPSTGFSTHYSARFGSFPIMGAPQLYDALTLIALGEAKALGAKDLVNRTLNEWMQQAAIEREGTPANWTDAGLATAFQSYSLGESCKLVGALGSYHWTLLPIPSDCRIAICLGCLWGECSIRSIIIPRQAAVAVLRSRLCGNGSSCGSSSLTRILPPTLRSSPSPIAGHCSLLRLISGLVIATRQMSLPCIRCCAGMVMMMTILYWYQRIT